MVVVPRDASEEQALDIVRAWVHVLAREDYQAVFEELGYLMLGDKAGTAEVIRSRIRSYRSSQYYPGVEEFVVTDWRTAQGGNPAPRQEVEWFRPPRFGMAGAVAFDLPLNGRWSDLTADFVIWECDDSQGYVLYLEEINPRPDSIGADGVS